MFVRRREARALKKFPRAVIVEPVFARLEAIDNRVASGCVVLRRVLAWRSVAATDVTAFGAAAQM